MPCTTPPDDVAAVMKRGCDTVQAELSAARGRAGDGGAGRGVGRGGRVAEWGG
jgi:hypothetical protein